MKPSSHLIISGIVCIFLFLLTPISYSEFLIIFLSSIFIDLDHALRYSIKTKDFSPFKFWKWSLKEREKREKYLKKYKRPIFIFHGIEFFILLGVLSYFYKIFLLILIGSLIHIFLDYIEIFYHKKEMNKFSQIYNYFENKK
jgi:hypothetical protein